MISWASSWAFILLIPAVATAFADRWRGVHRLPVVAVGTGATRSPRVWAARLMPFVRAVGLVLLVLSLARPRETERQVIVESEGLDIMLAIDTSGSMEARDFSIAGRPINRLEVAKGVVADFVGKRTWDRIGLVVFGEEAFTHVPLTLDHETLISVLGSVQLGMAGEGRTAIGSGIAIASKRLKDLDAPSRILILLTDGRNNAGRIDPDQASDAAAALGIKIYTIGIGGRGGGGLLGMFGGGGEGLDEDQLTRIAEKTGGRFFRATDTQTLQQIYATIDALEPSPAEVEELVRHHELFHWPLIPGLVLLAVEMLLSGTALRRAP